MFQMYARIEHIKHNVTSWLMVLDKTGTGEIVWYNLTAGNPPLHIQNSERTTCELLAGLQHFAIATIDNKVYVSGGFDSKDGAPVGSLLVYVQSSNLSNPQVSMCSRECQKFYIIMKLLLCF